MKAINGGNNFSQKLKPSFTQALIIIATLLTAIGSGSAQTLQQSDPVNVAQPDSIVQITAEAEGLTQVDPTTLPPFASCWWTVYPDGGPVPMPYLPDPSVPIYEIVPGSGIYLVDMTGGTVSMSLPRTGAMASATSSTVASAVERQGNEIANLIEQVQETQSEQTMAMAFGMDVPMPGDGGGGGTNSFSPDDSGFTIPDYGTNLWIAQTAVTNGWLTGIGSNTIADVQYDIQSRTNLLQTDWQSEGFIYGSEYTNWTPLSVPQIGRTNLFIRLWSWQSSDGSGLPDWWELEYFGTTGVDPNADPTGDGWSNIQKFQNGMNPNVFYSPPAPQGFTATYNNANGMANLSWLPSPGAVTGYTVTDSDGNTFNVSASVDSLEDNISGDLDDPWNQGDIDTTFQLQAHYGTNNSPVVGPVSVEKNTMIGSIVPGAQGTAYLAVSALPPNTAAIKLTVIDYYYLYFIDDTDSNAFTATYEIPISDFTNGLYQLPNDAVLGDGDFLWNYNWYGQAVGTNGLGLTATTWLTEVYTAPQDDFQNTWLVPPFFDGRAQLKQNLIFQLRAALADRPFQYTELYTNYGLDQYSVSSPTNYTYAGYFYFSPYYTGSGEAYEAYLDTFMPFEENYFDRNFVFNSSYLDSNGRTTTGVGGGIDSYGSGGLTIQTTGNIDDYLELPLAYEFVAPTTNGVTISSVLATNETRWLSTFPVDSSTLALPDIGVTNEYTYSPAINAMFSNVRNWFGLKYLSTEIGYAGPSTTTLYAGGNTTENGYFYPETEQPQFQIVGYNYWTALNPFYSVVTNGTDYPGMAGLSLTHTNPVLITSVGNSQFQVASFAKLEVTNSAYSGVYGYLQQYFDQAYQIDTNGNVTTNTTGILSPYGSFFATQPGPIALVTMPDVDTGQRGTNTVYALKIALDVNHDGTVNTSFGGPDDTSVTSPDQIWVNDNYDRWHDVDCTLGLDCDSEQDDLGAVDISKLPAYQQVPDCNFVDSDGQPAIPSTRDLEDYFRLWTPGVAALMNVLPSDYTVQLTLTGSGQIRIFQAIEPDGGTNYLFDETTASNQVAYSPSLYVGLLTASSPIILNIQTNFNEHFIFCGATNGSAQIDLQILDPNQNVVADAPAYLQINEIKEMYERWTVGDQPATNMPTSMPILATDDLPTNPPVAAFQYTQPLNTNTPYILFVHGWNMQTWEKNRYAEAAYKRLYWQGYQGRFGLFRWPTGNGFSGIISAITDARNYDNSESNAWASAVGLTNLLTQLNTEYPGHVYLMAHSMGNVVAGEALRLASSQLVNTYVAMQGAIPAHCYDPLATTNSTRSVPDDYAQYWTSGAPSYFNSTAGAGSYINFFNINDYALGWWNVDQGQKPDAGTTPAYHYVTPSGTNPSGFYKQIGSTEYNLYFPTNTYELFAYGVPSWSFALGAQPNVGGAFKTASQVELDIAPFNYLNTHKYHSAEFRSDNMSRANFWNAVITQMRIPH